jgi:hypothetical protein
MQSEKTAVEITQKAIATMSNYEEASLDGKEHGEVKAVGEERTEKSDDYPKGLKFVLITISIMLAVFIMALDTSIIGE